MCDICILYMLYKNKTRSTLQIKHLNTLQTILKLSVTIQTTSFTYNNNNHTDYN